MMPIVAESLAFRCRSCRKPLLFDLINESKHDFEPIGGGLPSVGDLMHRMASTSTISQCKRDLALASIPVLTRKTRQGKVRCRQCQEKNAERKREAAAYRAIRGSLAC